VLRQLKNVFSICLKVASAQPAFLMLSEIAIKIAMSCFFYGRCCTTIWRSNSQCYVLTTRLSTVRQATLSPRCTPSMTDITSRGHFNAAFSLTLNFFYKHTSQTALHFCSPQPDICKTTDTGLVHCVVCVSMPQLLADTCSAYPQRDFQAESFAKEWGDKLVGKWQKEDYTQKYFTAIIYVNLC